MLQSMNANFLKKSTNANIAHSSDSWLAFSHRAIPKTKNMMSMDLKKGKNIQLNSKNNGKSDLLNKIYQQQTPKNTEKRFQKYHLAF